MARGHEAVPKYSVEHRVEDGGEGTIHVDVALPGVTDASSIQCTVEEYLCRVHVPGRYQADIALSMPVEPNAEAVRFVKKKAVLRCVLRVVPARRPGAEGDVGSRSCSNDEPPPPAGDRGTPVARPANGRAASQRTHEPGRPLPPQQEQTRQAQQQQQQLGAQPDMYAQAPQQANRDAAEECVQRARGAEQQGDLDRAVRLLQKACQLVPGRYEQALAEASHKLAERRTTSSGGASSSSAAQAGPSSGGSSSRASTPGPGPAGAGGPGAGGAGGAQRPGGHGPAPQRAQQQQQQQQPKPQPARRAASPEPDAHASARSPAGERQQAQHQQAQARRIGTAVSGAVPMLLGLALVATAAYCMYLSSPEPLSEEAAALLERGPAAAAAAAAGAVALGTSAAGGGGSGGGQGPAAAPGIPIPMQGPEAQGAAGDEEWLPGPVTTELLRRLQAAASAQPAAEGSGEAKPLPQPGGASRPASAPSAPCEAEGGARTDGCAAAEVGSSSMAGEDEGGCTGSWWRCEAAAARALSWRALQWAWRALIWLPLVLVWQPSVAMLLSWTLGVGGLFLAGPPLYRLSKRNPLAEDSRARWKNLCIMLVWQPLAWLAAGGGWVALLATPLELTFPLIFAPAVFFVGRWPVRWLAPYLLLPPRLLVWTPHWWMHLPLALACFGAAVFFPAHSARSDLSLAASILVAHWWLLGGGWLAVAGTACLLTYPVAAILEEDGVGTPALRAVLRLVPWAAPGAIAGRVVWFFYQSLWLVTPLAIIFLGLIAVWQAESGSSGTGGGGSGTRYSAFFGGPRRRRKSTGGIPVHLENEVPRGAPEAVARVLRSGNYYEVLALDRDADDAAIRRSKRTLSLATHPDKIGNLPGVNEAFNLVTEAADVLGDAARRAQYEAELAQLDMEERLGSGGDGGGGFGFGFGGGEGEGPLRPEDADFGIPQQCSNCGGVHLLRPVLRPPEAARFCAECNAFHPVHENEVWIERSSAGWFTYELKMFWCIRGLIFDMTELANCQGFTEAAHRSGFRFNAHVNPYARAAARAAAGRARRQEPAGPAARNRKKRKGKR